VKLYVPVLLAVVEAVLAPLSATVAPAPPEMVPEIVYVAVLAVAVKVTPATLAPLTVTLLLVGVIAYPVLLAVTVYVPFGTVKLKLPEASAVVVEVAPPDNVNVAPLPPETFPLTV
jgi:hypothetical protein